MASVNYHYTFYGIIHFTDYGNKTNIWLICPSFGNFEIISSFSTKNINTYLATTKTNSCKN